MTITFSGDDDYRRFQFVWLALTQSNLVMTVAKMSTAHSLMGKLSLISRDDETPRGTGRVLLREGVSVELTDSEVILIVEAIAKTAWRAEVVHHVKDLCVWLGAEVVDTPQG